MQAFDHEVPYYDRQFTDAPIGRFAAKAGLAGADALFARPYDA